MNPALIILGPVIVISLLWIVAEHQHANTRLGRWLDGLIREESRPDETEVSGGAAASRAPDTSRAQTVHDPGISRPYSWGDDQDLCLALFRAELNSLPEVEEPVR